MHEMINYDRYHLICTTKVFLLGPVHTTPFLFVSVFVASKLPVHTVPFFTKTERKTSVFVRSRFCALTNTESKISVFVRSHCSGFVKLIIGY